MDGLADKIFDTNDFAQPENLGGSGARLAMQRTLANPIGCIGVGLHSGVQISLTLHPAPVNSGIVIRRSDLGISFPARFDLVTDTRLCTLLHPENRPDARVGTVEHVMAALAAMGVTNAVIEVDGPEIPVLDGSAAPFLFLLDCAGLVDQNAAAAIIEVRRPVRIDDGAGFAELLPSPAPGLRMEIAIDFSASVIGRQTLRLDLNQSMFRHELAGARTFAMAAEIDALRKAGLARGGSLENAVVVDNDRVLNPAGLHQPDEFVRHKMLDAVGDLYLAGAALQGIFRANRPGHALNNRLLRALFADQANYSLIRPNLSSNLSRAA
jgi:UDP-3-O-[3-hydroxymyristoyl] N-acetylglucosamine deacetylase